MKAVDMLSVDDDKLTLQKQLAELTEKSKEEDHIMMKFDPSDTQSCN
ncbi:MAG: hypothetical protein WAM14_12020 [Candidatus Nitrosopolaris sp.]